tara:strand:- start:1607 stop:2275 length:669 start_codon:yes stop_codon:yes gene_type:complete
MSYGVILAKILPQKFLNDFLDGNLHLNSDAFFARIDNDGFLRSDPNEGADEAIQFENISIKDKEGKWVPIGGAKNPLIYRYSNKKSRNILCLYMFTTKQSYEFDKRNMEFGDVAVVIKDLKEFIKRIKTASTKKEMGLFQAPVEYLDKKVHHGKMGPFRKFSEYEYQSEFRFVLDSEVQRTEKFIKLPIGDIRDITMVCTSDKLSDLPNKVQRYIETKSKGS